ncbi:MAG: hypothetical protein KAU28_10115, partial [Phycisphaerae bacterium]|nr:hypothetical protein [Phycisphaerae bacterium]
MPKLDRTRPIHLIVNPRSGHGGGRRLLSELRTRLRQDGWALAEHTTGGPGDAARYAADARDDAAVVIVWGGDGTISEATSALAGTDVLLLPCPAGTENLLGKEMHIPLHPGQLADALETGRIVECDLGRINGRGFLLIIGVGFDGEVVRRLTSARTGHISHLSYFWPLWRTFWEHDFPRMRIVADGEEIFNDFGLAFIGNISHYAVGLRICSNAQFDDGLLDLVVFRCRERARLMLHAAWTLLRRHPLKGDVLYSQSKKITIETDRPVACQVDGDLGPSTPVEACITGQRVKLLIPQPRIGWAPWTRKGDVVK